MTVKSLTVNAQGIDLSSATDTVSLDQSVFDHQRNMEEGKQKSARIPDFTSTSSDTSTLPNIVSPGSSVVAAAIPSTLTMASDVHCVESSGKLSMSFADGLNIEQEEDEDSSWSKEVSEDDDSEVDVSLVDSEDENSNANETDDDSTSSITGHQDEINEVVLSEELDTDPTKPESKGWEGGCISHTDDSSDSFVEDADTEINEQESDFNQSEKMETTTIDFIDSGLVSTKTDTIKTRRGVQRKPTGDSDTLGELLHGLASRSDDEHFVTKTVRRGRKHSSVDASETGPEDLNIDAPKKGPLKSRRGVQRVPTGDSDTLADMIQNGPKSISESPPKVMETTRRGGRRKPKNDAQIELTGIDEAVKSKEPLKTRRGVQRKATGDSDTLIALVQGMDSVNTPSHETSKVRRGGRKKERPSDDMKDPTDPSAESKGPLRTRKGLRRQATGDCDALADLIAHKGNDAA